MGNRLENHRKTMGKPWENGGLPSGKRLHNYGKSPLLLGEFSTNDNVQLLYLTNIYLGFKAKPQNMQGYLGI